MPHVICPGCQEEVPAGASEGLCPGCLLSSALFPDAPAPEPQTDPATLRRCGDYELLDVLARGGMGVIYRARQPGLSRVVALKMIAAAELAAADEVRRFRLEAELIARLDHPNIVPVHGVGEHEGMPFFVMKLAAGGSLAQHLTDGPARSPRDCAALMVKVARAVHFAHERGVLHRDLKPANILLETSGEPLVADFGLARLAQSASLTTAAVGTPAYMAPEQAYGSESVTTASDVYGLGAILYHLLTGQTPFSGRTALEVLRRAESEEPPSPAQRNKAVDRDLATVCLKCLEKTPAKRYRSAAALADDLERWLGGEAVAARPASWHERLWKWCRRRPAAATLTAALILGSAVLAAILAQGNVALRRERNFALEKESEARAGTARAEQSEATMRENVYAADIFLARRALDDGHLGLARQSLQRHIPREGESDLRGYEWYALDQLCRGDERHTFTGHEGAVLSLAVSPDGKLAASGGRDGLLQVWNLETNTLAKSLPDQPQLGKVGELALLAGLPRKSPETAALVGRVNLDELRMRARATSLGDVAALAWSPDGTTLISAGEGSYVRLWKTADWSYQGFIPVKAAVQAAWTSDGSHIILYLSGPQGSRSSGEVRVYDAASLALVRSIAPVVAGFALAGKAPLLTTVAQDGRVSVIHPATGELKATWGSAAFVSALAMSADGSRLAIMHQDHGTMWDVESHEQICEFQPAGERVRALAFSPDARHLAAGGSALQVQLIDTSSGTSAGSLRGHEDELLCLEYVSGTGRILTGSNDHTVRLWNASGPEQARTFLPGRMPLAGAAGDFAVGLDNAGSFLCRNLRTGAVSQGTAAAGSRMLGFDAAGTSFALLEPDGKLRWHGTDGVAGPAVPLPAAAGMPATPVAASLRNGWVAVVQDKAPAVLWSATDGSRLRALPPAPERISRLAASPDGRWLAALHWPRTVSLCDMTRSQWSVSVRVTAGIVGPICFSPDGRYMATGGDDNLVTVWNTADLSPAAVLRGHRAEIKALTFSPDGRTLISSSADLSIRLWHVPTWRELGPLHRGALAPALEFAGDDLIADDYDRSWILLPGRRKISEIPAARNR